MFSWFKNSRLRELKNQSEHVFVVNQVKKLKSVDINLAAVLFWACFENLGNLAPWEKTRRTLIT